MLSRFNTIPERDRQTYRQTDGHNCYYYYYYYYFYYYFL